MKPKTDRQLRTAKGRTEFWRINPRTELRWRNKGVPMRDVAKMMEWAKTQDQTKLPDGFCAKRAELEGKTAVIPGQADADWSDFEKQVRTEDPKDAMAKIAKARDWAYFKFEKAAGNPKQEKHYSDLLAKMESTLHDMQLRAKKLGVDSGELVTLTEFERLIAATAATYLRCIDAKLPGLCRDCIGKTDFNSVRKVLEPVLLSAAMFEPFVAAARVATGEKMPARINEKIIDVVDDYLQNGRAEMVKALAT